MSGTVPSTPSTVWTLVGVTLKRLGRGKALWIGVVIAALPLVFATILRAFHAASPARVFLILRLLLTLLPAMFIGASIGDEIEGRTNTYLWSRPIARWAVLAGKLCALTPIVIVLIVGGWYAAIQAAGDAGPSAISCVALAAGCVATSLTAAGITTVVPRYGMALSIGYMLVDNVIGALPFSLQELSITYQANQLANLGGAPPAIATPLIAMAVLAGLWGAVGFVRIRRLEA
jgi:ABC-type transport system involved in multi-copper enzyme maturation permease subunit